MERKVYLHDDMEFFCLPDYVGVNQDFQMKLYQYNNATNQFDMFHTLNYSGHTYKDHDVSEDF